MAKPCRRGERWRQVGQLVLGFRLVGLGEGGRVLRLDAGDYDALFIKNVKNCSREFPLPFVPLGQR
jgi:hypothetical protein